MSSFKCHFTDARLAKIQNVLCQDFATILGSKNKFAYAEYVPKLPYNDIYRIGKMDFFFVIYGEITASLASTA